MSAPSLALTLGVSLTAFVAELFWGLTTFGVAITFHVGFHLCHLAGLMQGTVREVVLGLALPDVAVALVQSVRLRRGVDMPLLLGPHAPRSPTSRRSLSPAARSAAPA